MYALIVRRLVALAPIMLIVSFAVFLLISLVPGDAATTLAGGVTATPERIEQVRKDLHLDDPTLVQYGHWLGKAVQGDLGESLYSHRSVTDDLLSRFPITLSLVVASLFVALLIGIPLGILSGLRPHRPIDRFSRVVSSTGVAVPDFLVAVFLVAVIAVGWHLLPPSGFTRITDSPVEWLRTITLPALALGFAMAAYISRQLRAELIDVLDSNYVRTGWAKGGRARVVVAKHALKNAAMPAVTTVGLQIGYLLGGTVIIEQIFSIPGLGTYFIRGITGLDLPVIQGCTLMLVTFQVTASALTDICYGLVNPKIRVH